MNCLNWGSNKEQNYIIYQKSFLLALKKILEMASQPITLLAGNTSLAFYTCFVDDGVMLVPFSYYNSPELIESFQQTIASLRPQLKTDLEVGALLNAGHRKGYASFFLQNSNILFLKPNVWAF